MEIKLNEELVRRVNNQTMYDRGNVLEHSANIEYDKFLNHYGSTSYNNEQANIIEKRRKVFKEFLTQSYNELLNIASNHVSVMVAGPANYPAAKMNKVADRMFNKEQEIEEKINRFYENTDKMIKAAYSKDEILEKYRNGYDEPISSDDPIAKDKLQAKLEFLENRHQDYKKFNKDARKNNEEQLPSYLLANSNQNIKAVKDRIQSLEKMEKLNDVGYYFDGGEVRFDKEDMRTKIYFDSKPSEEVRTELKSHGFRWSPTNQAWQRKLTQDSIYTTKRMFKDIGNLEINLVADYTKQI